jgi:hypothetical protein
MTDVCLILDASGSMGSKVNQTRVAFDGYIQGIKADRSVENVYTVVFNSNHITRIHDGVHPDTINPLNKENYATAGMTPLYDAMGKTLETMVGGSMFVVVITDGQENDSREFTRQDIADIIVAKEALGWDFIYLGADFDAWGQARQLGAARGKTLSFSGDQFREGMQAAREATQAYNTTGAALPDDYFDGYFDSDTD